MKLLKLASDQRQPFISFASFWRTLSGCFLCETWSCFRRLQFNSYKANVSDRFNLVSLFCPHSIIWTLLWKKMVTARQFLIVYFFISATYDIYIGIRHCDRTIQKQRLFDVSLGALCISLAEAQAVIIPLYIPYPFAQISRIPFTPHGASK